MIGLLLIASSGFADERPAEDVDASETVRPNILILYADDLGLGDLRCYNADSKIPTPNLDRLAAGGLRFLDGHSSSGICTPSRYALLTGRHHWRDFHGIVNAFGQPAFKPGQWTMPLMLRQQGYATAAIGKWHLGWDWESVRRAGANSIGAKPIDAKPIGGGRGRGWTSDAFDWTRRIPGGPLDRGFDHYFGDNVINFPPYCWIEDDRVTATPDRMLDTASFKPIKEGRWEMRPGPMVQGWDPYQNIPTTTRRGVRYIQQQANRDEPFFLYFAFPSPHAPIIPNDAFDGMSEAGPYGDFVAETDAACGELLDALERSGQAENTIVIFTADNGPEKYAYDRDANFGHWSSHPLRGLKRDLYEGGHHVPMIIRWPGHAAEGGVSKSLVSQIDLMATLASITDAHLPDDAAVDSHDLGPVLQDPTASIRTTMVHNTKADHYAIRDGDWLLVDGPTGYVSGRNRDWERRHDYPPPQTTEVELYNLRDDIGQRRNVASEQPVRVEAMRRLLQNIRNGGSTAPRLDKKDVSIDAKSHRDASTRSLASAKADQTSAANGARPNLVLIIADDMNWNDCGAYGHPSIRTPNIDALAAGGLLFRHAYLTTNSCSPSRCSLLTGRYPHNTGAEQLHWPLPPSMPSFAERLRSLGYYTAAAGKWHLGDPARDGFDRIEEASTAGFVLPSGDDGRPPVMVAKQPSGCEDWQRTLAERPRDQPFMMWLAALDPHREYTDGALQPPHDTSDVVVPPHLPDTAAVREDLRLYYDEIGRLDHYVGIVVDELKRQEVDDNTLILFISDNGRPFPRDKTTLYDGGIRTPWIVRWPAEIAPGGVTEALVSSVDVAATFLELAGDPAFDKNAEGSGANRGWSDSSRSFAGLLTDPAGAHRQYAFAEDHWHDYEDHGRCVVTTNYKLIRNDYVDLPNTPPADAGRSPTWQTMLRMHAAGELTSAQQRCFLQTRPRWELYDLRRDPGELRNVYDDPVYADIRDRLTAALQSWSDRTDDFMPTVRTPDEFDRVTGEPDASVRVRPRRSKVEMFGTTGAY